MRFFCLPDTIPARFTKANLKSQTVSDGRTAWLIRSSDDGYIWCALRELTAEVKKPELGEYKAFSIQLQHRSHSGTNHRAIQPPQLPCRRSNLAGSLCDLLL